MIQFRDLWELFGLHVFPVQMLGSLHVQDSLATISDLM